MIDTIEVDSQTSGKLLPDIDARAVVEEVGPLFLAYLRGTVTKSTDPTTGAAKRGMSPRSAKRPRKGGRGYATGELAEGLAIEVKGRGSLASVVVRVPASRHVFTVREAGRGVTYLSAEGLAGRVIDEVVDTFIREEVEGRG